MDFVTVAYLIVLGMFGFTFLFVLFFIAGKDIILAFRRRFQPKGCDIFIANTNRNISHYYRVPKNNAFQVGKVTYFTNPEKTLNLSDEDKKAILSSKVKKQKRLQDRIDNLNTHKKQLDALIEKEKDERNKYQLQTQISHIDNLIVTLTRKQDQTVENYFKEKRPAFFYIEGEPIPKDFYEYYSNLDSKIVDNIVSRKITEAVQTRTEKSIGETKLWILGVLIGLGLTLFMVYRCFTMLKEVCNHLGLTCAL